MSTFLKAYQLAFESHIQQYRKHSGAPYMVHPLEVVKTLGIWGIRRDKFENVWSAAILHDVIEDTTTPYEQIRDLCGFTIADIVSELTYVPNESKEEYLQSFQQKSVESLVIKLADRYCNVSDYLKQDPVYAAKYMRKADPLLKSMAHRGIEIVEHFGRDVHESILLDFIEIKHQIKIS